MLLPLARAAAVWTGSRVQVVLVRLLPAQVRREALAQVEHRLDHL